MHITMFLKNGQTLRFEDVTNLKKEEKFYNIITYVGFQKEKSTL